MVELPGKPGILLSFGPASTGDLAAESGQANSRQRCVADLARPHRAYDPEEVRHSVSR